MSKVLLEKYISMVLTPGMIIVRNDPELIELESSDEETTDDTSIVIVDLGNSGIARDEQSRKVKACPNVNFTDAHDNVKPLQTQSFNSKTPSASSSTSVADISKLDDSDVFIVRDCIKEGTLLLQSPTSNFDKSQILNCSQHIVKNSAIGDSDVIVIDSVNRNSSIKPPILSIHTRDILKDSNQRGRKRKLESVNVKEIEVVDIVDDDVIVLDDSLVESSSGKCSTFTGTDTNCKSNSWQTLDNIENLTDATPSSVISLADTNQSSNLVIVSEINENECDKSKVDKLQVLSPAKKKSKLVYHRPAHLVSLLTKPSPDIPSTKADAVSNIYNPNKESSKKWTGLRPIVIDGNNVAISYGKGTFLLKGIQICVNFFEKRGHRQIKVFVPQYRMNRDTHDDLQKMERKGLVVLTPSRKVNGKVLASYDDRYIVQYAAEFGGVIVSSDNFRDLLSENPSWKETIETRLLMFTWVDDLLMFPQDPLGRNGPSLDDFLKFPDS